jgi:hypothetical protein
MPYIMVYFTTSVIITFSTASLPTWLTSIISCQLGSLEFLALVVYNKVIFSSTILLLAATDAHNGAEGVFGCAYKD